MTKRRPQDHRPEGSYFGVVVGIVTNNQDPENLGRVKVRFPWLFDDDESFWARLVMPMAGKERGWWFNPEVDDEVLVGFFHGDVHHPFILGSLWNGQDTQPDGLKNDEETNDTRMIKSRSGHKLIFYDKDGEEYVHILDKTLENWWKLDTKENSQTINSDNGHLNQYAPKGQITWEAKEIAIKIGGDVTLEVGADHTVQAGTTSVIEAGPKMTWKAPQINLNPPGASAGTVGNIKASAGIAMERVDSEETEWAVYSEAAIAAAGAVTTAGPPEAAEEPAPADEPPAEPPRAVIDAAWETEVAPAEAREPIEISATVDNIDDGTPATVRIYDRTGNLVAVLSATVEGGKVTTEWTPEVATDGVPEFTVEVEAESMTSASSVLTLTSFVDITLRDERGVPMAGAELELVLADGTSLNESTDADGHFRKDDLYAGNFDIRAVRPSEIAAEGEPAEGGEFDESLEYRSGIPAPTGKTILLTYDRKRALQNARWSLEMLKLGESVKLLADANGLAGSAATVKIYLVLPDQEKELGEVPATVSGDTVEIDWSLAEFEEELEPYMVRGPFKPEVFFVITADDKSAKSPRVPVVDWVEFEVTDIDGDPVVDAKYTLVLPDGTERQGRTGADGIVREEDVPHGKCGLIMDDQEFSLLV